MPSSQTQIALFTCSASYWLKAGNELLNLAQLCYSLSPKLGHDESAREWPILHQQSRTSPGRVAKESPSLVFCPLVSTHPLTLPPASGPSPHRFSQPCGLKSLWPPLLVLRLGLPLKLACLSLRTYFPHTADSGVSLCSLNQLHCPDTCLW